MKKYHYSIDSELAPLPVMLPLYFNEVYAYVYTLQACASI